MAATHPSLQLIQAVADLSTESLQQLRHQHEFYEAAFIIDGEGFFRINDLSISVRRGMVILVPRGLYHAFYSGASSCLRYAVLDFDSGTPEFLAEERGLTTASVTDGSDYIDYVGPAFRSIIALWNDGTEESRGASAAIGVSLLQLLQVMFRRSSEPVLSNEYSDATTPLVHQIYHYIADNHAERLTLQSVADHFRISTSTLSHSFVKAFGVSPIEHLLHARVVKSTWYLVRTNMTLDEIAEKVGYTTTSLYLRQFRDRMGCKPTELRRRRKQNVAVFEPGVNMAEKQLKIQPD